MGGCQPLVRKNADKVACTCEDGPAQPAPRVDGGVKVDATLLQRLQRCDGALLLRPMQGGAHDVRHAAAILV